MSDEGDSDNGGESGEAGGGEWMRVAGLDQCRPGTLLGVEAGQKQIVLANVDGDLYALQDRCSHEDQPLSDGDLDDDQLECLYHGATFDVCTGNAMTLPAVRPVETYAVEVRGPDIYVRV